MQRTKSAHPLSLLERVRRALRLRHRSARTEKAYVGWVRRFVLFHNKRHPSELGAEAVTAFLSYLATVRKCRASTQMVASGKLAKC